MNCRKVRSCLSAYYDDLLTKDRFKELEDHIRNCKSCEQEKRFTEQILTAAQQLPQKKAPEDFNLKLLNRIYAEQSCPTESYLPQERESVLRRPLAWISVAVTACTVAVVALVSLDSGSSTDREPPVPSFTESSPAGTITPVAASRWENNINQYADRIGVSGATSPYRAVSNPYAGSMRLSDATVESLLVEMQRKMGDVSGSQYSRSLTDQDWRRLRTQRGFKPLIRNASSRR